MMEFRKTTFGYNEVSSGEESSFESKNSSPPRRQQQQQLLRTQRQWQKQQQQQRGNNFLNPFGIGLGHLDRSDSGSSLDHDDDGDYEQNSRGESPNDITTGTGDTAMSKYAFSETEAIGDQTMLSSTSTTASAATTKRTGKSFSNSFSFARNGKAKPSRKHNESSASLVTTNEKRDGKHSKFEHTTGNTSLDTTNSRGRSHVVTPGTKNHSSASSVMHSSSLQSSSMMSSLMPSMNLVSSGSSEDDSSHDSEAGDSKNEKHTNKYSPHSQPLFLDELPKHEEEEPPRYYSPAYWNTRLSRREVYSRHYRPSRKEQDELIQLEQFLGIPDARKNKKNVILYQWMQLNPSEKEVQDDGLPRSIILKRGPIAWSNHDECELVFLTRGFVIARKIFQYIPRFQTSDTWANVTKVTPTGVRSFAICCGKHKTLEFTCPTATDKESWLQASKIVVLQAHTHSSFKNNEKDYDIGWQYRLIHTPWFTEAVTGVVRFDAYEIDQIDNRTINNLDTYNSYAPLHYAVRANHVDAMRFLLQAGADPNVADGFGRTPMFYADLDQLPKSSIDLLESHGAKRPNSNKNCLSAPAPKTQTTARCRRCTIVILILLLLATGVTTFLIWYLGKGNGNKTSSFTSGQSQATGPDSRNNGNDDLGAASSPVAQSPPPFIVTDVNPIPATDLNTVSPLPTVTPDSKTNRPTNPPTLQPSTASSMAPSITEVQNVASPTENPTMGPSGQIPDTMNPSGETSFTSYPTTPMMTYHPTSSPTVPVTEIATTYDPTSSPTVEPTGNPTAGPAAAPSAATNSSTYLFGAGPTSFPTFETIYPQFELPEDINLFNFLVENSLDKGASLHNPKSAQYQAFRWLSGNSELTTYSDERKIQRYALAVFYYSTGGDQWSNNDNWLSNKDECTMWFSRIADFGPSDTICNGDGLVTNLNLDYNNLRSKIPQEVGLLQKLRTMNFYGGPQTFLSGSLPSELFLLTDLEYFSIRGNQLTSTIPSLLGNLPLETLNLSQNKFVGEIPSVIGLLSKLTDLSMETNRLSSSLPTDIGRIQGLKSIKVGTNKLSGALPSELGKLVALQAFEAELNNFSSVPSEFGRLTNLTTLELTINNIQGPLPTEIGGMRALQSLLLRGNQLKGPIPTEIGLLTMLQAILDLSFNQLSGTMPTELAALTMLRGLYLNANLLSGEIPSFLAQLSQINTLRLEMNKFTGSVPMDVCDVYQNTYPTFYADCLEVACSCCTYCCVDGSGCSCEYAGTANEFLC